MKPENLAALDRGLRNSLMLFANNPYVSQAFRGKREGQIALHGTIWISIIFFCALQKIKSSNGVGDKKRAIKARNYEHVQQKQLEQKRNLEMELSR